MEPKVSSRRWERSGNRCRQPIPVSSTQRRVELWPCVFGDRAVALDRVPGLLKEGCAVLCGMRHALFAVMEDIDVARVARGVAGKRRAAGDIALRVAMGGQ